jgi:hypothetical protein
LAQVLLPQILEVRVFGYTLTHFKYKALLTECEVCTGKYLPEVLVQRERRRSEVCAKKPEDKYFPVQTEQMRVISLLLRASSVNIYLTFELVRFACSVFPDLSATNQRAPFSAMT